MNESRSDGSTASYYRLPAGATELQQLISHRDMNAQIGEIFRACYRYGMASHSDQMRDAKKILFYAQAEVQRLEGAATDPDGWHKWYGSEDCPVAAGVRVQVRYSDDYEGTGLAGSLAWGRSGDKVFITHWRLAK